MNVNRNESKSGIIGVTALVVGMAIGAAGMVYQPTILGASRTTNTTTHQTSSALAVAPKLTSRDQWNPFQEIQKMQLQMNQSFNEMFEKLRLNPQFNLAQGNPGYSLSLDVEDVKNRYEVRAFLPDAKASDVHVNLENGRMLKVEVDNNQTATSAQSNETSRVTEWGQYEQMVQLPTPGEADRMTIKHQGHELIITIPKAA